MSIFVFFLFSACAYGDKFSWCSGYIARITSDTNDCSNLDDYWKENCCMTCDSSSVPVTTSTTPLPVTISTKWTSSELSSTITTPITESTSTTYPSTDISTVIVESTNLPSTLGAADSYTSTEYTDISTTAVLPHTSTNSVVISTTDTPVRSYARTPHPVSTLPDTLNYTLCEVILQKCFIHCRSPTHHALTVLHSVATCLRDIATLPVTAVYAASVVSKYCKQYQVMSM